MVDPDLETTPASRKGECCIVQDVRIEVSTTRMYVAFVDGKIDYFTPNHLLMLRPKRDVFKNLLATTAKEISKLEYKGGLNILHLAAEKKHEEALKMAMSTDFYKKLCVINCQDWVIRKEQLRLKQFKQKRTGI